MTYSLVDFKKKFEHKPFPDDLDSSAVLRPVVYKIAVYDQKEGVWFNPCAHNYGFWTYKDAKECASKMYGQNSVDGINLDIENWFVGELPDPVVNWEESKRAGYWVFDKAEEN